MTCDEVKPIPTIECVICPINDLPTPKVECEFFCEYFVKFGYKRIFCKFVKEATL